MVVGVVLTACFFCLLPLRADTDFNHNGMSDIWELKYNASGLSTNPDTDGDSQNNLAESISGTNPFDAKDALKIVETAKKMKRLEMLSRSPL